jgi:FkbM family methyltransferase
MLKQIISRWTAAKWALLRATRETITVRTKQGVLTVSTHDDVIGRLLYNELQYQHDLSLRSLSFLREKGLLPGPGNGVVLDVGANIGVISIGLLVNGQFESAIGLEPDPTNFALCKRNVVQNGLVDRFTLLPIAASDRAGSVQFELSPDNFGDHRVRSQANGSAKTPVLAGSGRDSIAVEASPIDVILGSLPSKLTDSISLVWIDVQGHEGFVFAGGPRLFSRHIPVVAEIWPFGILQSGMSIPRFCEIASGYWSHFWVWRRCCRYVQYPSNQLLKFCEELGESGSFDDVVFCNA